MFKLKANCKIVLPDGKTEIDEGAEFEWNREVEIFGKDVEIIGESGSKAPANNEEEAAVRARAKELKIASWHNKRVENLKVEIAVKEADLAAAGEGANAGE